MYTGEKLDRDLTLAGAVRVTLHVSSDCPDTDFIAKLIEVTPDGRALLLMDGVSRALYRESVLIPPTITRSHSNPARSIPSRSTWRTSTIRPRRQSSAGRYRQQ